MRVRYIGGVFDNHKTITGPVISARRNRREYNAAYYLANRDRLKAIADANYIANREKINVVRAAHRARNRAKNRAYARDYRAAHPEKVKADNAAYAAANRTKLNAYYSAYAKANPEKRNAICSARRARKLNATVGDVKLIVKWEKSWRSKKFAVCFWCRKKTPSRKCHTDHIAPLSKGGAHSIENLCVSCQPCNNRKHAKTVEEWNATLRQPALL